MTTKRPFVRREGQAYDEYVSGSGTRTTHQMSLSALGESLSDEERATLLEAVGQGHSGAAHALRSESSPEHLEALLTGLQENIGAPGSLIPYLADPRVAPALISSARAFALGTGSNHYQVVAMIGGAEARSALRERMGLLSADERCWVDDPFFNALAGELAVVSGGLLKLAADELEAADCLARLAAHPCEFNRSTALRDAADAFDFGLRTKAMLRLRGVFEALDLNASEAEFTAALPVVMVLRPEAATTRCRALLFDQKRKDRRFFPASLVTLPLHTAALSLLVEWIPTEPDPRVVLGPAIMLRSAFTAAFIEDLFRRALMSESPSLRRDAIKLLPLLPSADQRTLAVEALHDEPDPALRRDLAALAAT